MLNDFARVIVLGAHGNHGEAKFAETLESRSGDGLLAHRVTTSSEAAVVTRCSDPATTRALARFYKFLVSDAALCERIFLYPIERLRISADTNLYRRAGLIYRQTWRIVIASFA